jgi:hypothetical protein
MCQLYRVAVRVGRDQLQSVIPANETVDFFVRDCRANRAGL